MIRTLIAELWSGPRTLARLRPIDSLTDADILGQLKALGVGEIPATAVERRARLASYPSTADLDALAVAWTPWNDGVRPTIRLLEEAPSGRRRSPAGSLVQ